MSSYAQPIIPPEVEAIRKTVELLTSAVGPMDAIEALEGGQRPVTEYEAQNRLLMIGNLAAQSRSRDDQFQIATRIAESSVKFLIKRQNERVRQAELSFNWTLILFVLGSILLLGGLACALAGLIKAAVLTVAGGVLSKIIAGVMLKLYREANSRLDKVKINLPKLQIMLLTLQQSAASKNNEDAGENIHIALAALRRM